MNILLRDIGYEDCTMDGSGYGQSVAWGVLASAVVNVRLLSETKVYEATLACCHVASNVKRQNI